MTEIGIDPPKELPKPVTDNPARAADVVAMGCGDVCPVYPGKPYQDWVLDDPMGQTVRADRPTRDEIDPAMALPHDLLGPEAINPAG